jgi:hypothetical protein
VILVVKILFVIAESRLFRKKPKPSFFLFIIWGATWENVQKEASLQLPNGVAALSDIIVL